MEKKSKLLALVLFLLGLGCFAMYYLSTNQESGEYKVVFDTQGGSIVAEQVVKKGEKATKPDDPSKENSDFVEWQLDGVAYSFDSEVLKNITLVAKWNDVVLHNVKVTLDQDEFTANVRDGDALTIEALNIPAKEGHKIKLYNENSEEYELTQPVTTDLVLTAKYIEIKTYTVKFDSNGGSKVEEVKVNEGETISSPTTTRDGYTFDAWYLGEEKFDFTTPISKNITLKAKWTEKGKINVTFMADDKVHKVTPVKENTKVTKPNNPTKKGYRFVEWQLNGTAFDFNTKITEEITLTALFEEAKSYTVSFNSDGGSKVSSQEVEAGSKAKKPTAPTKEGYVFREWQLNGKTYDFNKAVEDDLALKAIWDKEAAKYTVTFDSNGGSAVESQTVVEGNKATKPADPTKEGYKFAEWLYKNNTYDFNTEVRSDITLTARYEKETVETPSTPEQEQNTGDIETQE